MPGISHSHSRSPRGFTLLEIAIVMLMFGILVAIALPQFASSSNDAQDANIRATLANIRMQMEIFKAQHNDQPPALAAMWTVLIKKSDTNEAASIAPTGTNLGPYLKNIPINPWNNLTNVSSAPIDPAAGWYYSPNAGQGYALCIRNADGSVNPNY